MGNPRSLGPFYLCGDLVGPCRYQREVVRVDWVEPLSWKPGYAMVGYTDAGRFGDSAGPIKIYERKNGTHYVQFTGRRGDVDMTKLDQHQHIDLEKGLIDRE